MTIRPILLSALLALGLSTPAHSGGTGELILTVDGEERVVPLWENQSDWSGSENWPSVNIYARAFNEAGENPLVVTLGFEAPQGTPGSPELTVTQYEDGAVAERLFSGSDAEDGGLSVVLERQMVDGSTLSLSGSFTGTIGTSENRGRDIDLSNGIAVQGTFSVTLDELK